MTDAVPGFDVTTLTHKVRTHEVYRAGTGPAVIVMHELPGLYPGMVTLGRRLVDAGHWVYLPSLFGRPGAPLLAGQRARHTRCSPRTLPTPPVIPTRDALDRVLSFFAEQLAPVHPAPPSNLPATPS